MCPPTRSLLILGLGRFAPTSTPSTSHSTPTPTPSHSTIAQKVSASLTSARAAGFDCESLEVNPLDPSTSLAEVRAKLRERRRDGVVVGYGVRGLKEFTPFFEEVMQVVLEETWGVDNRVRLMFSTAPDGIMEAVGQGFPGVGVEGRKEGE